MLIISNEEKRRCPPLEAGETITCPKCEQPHTVRLTIRSDGSPGTILYVRCQATGNKCVVGLDGKDIRGLEGGE